MTGVLRKGRNLDTERGTENGVWRRGFIAISQGTQKIASEPPESRREEWSRFSLTALRRNQPGDILVLDFSPPEL